MTPVLAASRTTATMIAGAAVGCSAIAPIAERWATPPSSICRLASPRCSASTASSSAGGAPATASAPSSAPPTGASEPPFKGAGPDNPWTPEPAQKSARVEGYPTGSPETAAKSARLEAAPPPPPEPASKSARTEVPAPPPAAPEPAAKNARFPNLPANLPPGTPVPAKSTATHEAAASPRAAPPAEPKPAEAKPAPAPAQASIPAPAPSGPIVPKIINRPAPPAENTASQPAPVTPAPVTVVPKAAATPEPGPQACGDPAPAAEGDCRPRPGKTRSAGCGEEGRNGPGHDLQRHAEPSGRRHSRSRPAYRAAARSLRLDPPARAGPARRQASPRHRHRLPRRPRKEGAGSQRRPQGRRADLGASREGAARLGSGGRAEHAVELGRRTFRAPATRPSRSWAWA